MAYAFFLGIDGDAGEDDAPERMTLSLLEKEKNSDDELARYRLDRIRHYSEGVSAGPLADRIQGLVAESPYIGRTSIIVNRGGATRGTLLDALKDRGLDPVAATLTAGSGTVAGGRDEVGVQVGAADAIQTLVQLYGDERFVVEEHSTEAASHLARTLQRAFEVLDEAQGDHAAGTAPDRPVPFDEADAHLTSAALAAWLGSERSFDPSQHLKEDPQTNRR